MPRPASPEGGERPDAAASDAEIRAEIRALNLRRSRRFSLILVPIHLAHVVLFARFTEAGDPVSESWRQGILTAHSVMLLVALGLAALGTFAIHEALPHRVRDLIPTTGAILYLIFGVVLTVIDQLITTSIAPLLLTTIAVASATFIPPATAAVLFSALLITFWNVISWTQTDPEILLSIRVNTISLAGIGFGIAYLFWRSQILAIRQRIEIEARKLELEEKNRELALLATRDALTGVANRSQLTSALVAELSRMKRTGSPASIVLLDLDHFKAVNDSHGHPTGDAVLREIAHLLSAEVRSIDTLARLGGEEFAILLPDTPLEAAAELAERLRQRIEGHEFNGGSTSLRLTASFGVAPIAPEAPDPINSAYKAADRLLYRAKESERNRVFVMDAPPAPAEVV